MPHGLTKAEVTVKLNTDFGIARMSSQDLQAVVAAWQSGAISRDTMFELFRSGEILPDGRTNEDEKTLISTEGTKIQTPRFKLQGNTKFQTSNPNKIPRQQISNR